MDLSEYLKKHYQENTVWLAEEAVIDDFENDLHLAFIYATVGFFRDEDKAFEWASEGGMVTREECWAVSKDGFPRRRITMISSIT